MSVHAFASDPTRGCSFSVCWDCSRGGALRSTRCARATSRPRAASSSCRARRSCSRTTFCSSSPPVVVLVGTLAPLFIDALGLGKISVGPPYFNLMFLLPVLPLVVLIGVGMHTGWRSMPGDALLRRLRWPAARGRRGRHRGAARLVRHGVGADGAGASRSRCGCARARLLDPLRRLVFRTGAPLTRGAGRHVPRAFRRRRFHARRDGRLGLQRRASTSARGPATRVEAGGYEFVFNGRPQASKARISSPTRASSSCATKATLVAVLTPQIRTYQVQTEPMTEAAIDTNVVRDVFVALGEPLGDNAWSVRLQVKPLIGFLWLGSGLMALGGLVAITDRRYRARRAADAAQRRRSRRRERHSHVALRRYRSRFSSSSAAFFFAGLGIESELRAVAARRQAGCRRSRCRA